MKTSLQKKAGANNKTRLRIVYYNGTTKTAEGKTKAHRRYEETGCWLYTKPRTPQERAHNKEAMKLAGAILSKRALEVQAGKHDLADNSKLNGSFIEFFERLTAEKGRTTTRSNHSIWYSTLKHLKRFAGGTVTFQQINSKWLEAFKQFLLTEPLTKSETLLAPNTAANYFNKVRAALNQAQTDGIIRQSPTVQVKSIKPKNEKREYLTVDELKAVVQTECRYDVLKRAFLFSCLTGMRWSDIHQMTWSMVREFAADHHRVVFNQQKTDGLQYLDLNARAVELLGERGQPNERVFSGLKYSAYTNVALKQWMMRAGIGKEITFHCARHTFAVIQLSRGADIYTVSKLLGHTELKTTQIYADILDTNRHRAMQNLPNILGGMEPEQEPAELPTPPAPQEIMGWLHGLTERQKTALKLALLNA